MAAAKMRHYNSPEELAKRQDIPAGTAEPRKGFRHYNHPDEIAKRAGKSPAAPQRALERYKPAPAEQSLPLFADDDDEPSRPLAGPLSSADPLARLELLERMLFAFVDDAREAREFRRLLGNFQAVTDSQLELGNRVRAVEATLQDLAEQLEADDDEPEPKRDTKPPPATAAAAAPGSPVVPSTEPTT